MILVTISRSTKQTFSWTHTVMTIINYDYDKFVINGLKGKRKDFHSPYRLTDIMMVSITNIVELKSERSEVSDFNSLPARSTVIL